MDNVHTYQRIRTNERCYICDYRPPTDASEKDVYSSYEDSLSDEGSPKRLVFVDPRDGKPVCTTCSRHIKANYNDLTRQEEDKKLVSEWENILEQSLAQPADLREEIEREIT